MLRWLALTPAIGLSVWIAVANRQDVRFSLDPFAPDAPAVAFNLPLYLLLFATGLLGMLLGGFVMWLAQGRHRQAARTERRRAEGLAREKQAAEAGPTRG